MGRDGIRMVCFDAGGVLVRICRSWREGCVRSGVPFRRNPEADARERERRELSDDYQRGVVGCADFFEQMAGLTGGLYNAEEIRRVHDAWIIGEYPGVHELILALHTRDGLTTGLLSNTSASHWSQRLMFGGGESSAVGSVRHPHASHLLGLIKPGEAIYRAFERETGFRPSEILFFDDLLDNVEGAARAGWEARRIDHEGDTASQIERALRGYGLF
ncbi:MAG: HAD-IA family hydrolase [Phycisphaerales bacterium]|nr:HAD-IA family hydrolase [Phycisphaerales bacterium]